MLPEFQIKKPRKSGMKILLLAVFLLVAFGIGIISYSYVKINKPSSSVSVPVSFSVPKGASTRDVGESLEEKNLVGSSFLFTMYALMTNANGKIQAGDYSLDRNMTMKQILNVLTSGKVTRNEKKVTLVEGWTNKQVQAELVEKGLVTNSNFEAALNAEYDYDFADAAKKFDYEGFLFPDTYSFDASYSAEDIVKRMLKNFDSKLTAQMRADMKAKDLTIEDAIIMASIIEREVGRSSSVNITSDVSATMQQERENVASVFYNRLNINMALQSDATVNYITGKNDRQAKFEDIKINSPYNTYVNTGLPPGPISNPGIGSITAAIYPAHTDYIYFLSKPSGEAVFAKTLDEHNANRAKYLD